jgi:hypothetical protein
MSKTNSKNKGINININKKNYPSRCQEANIIEIKGNPYLDIDANILHVKINLIYLDPKSDPNNPLNYLIITSQELAIEAGGIFSIGNLETSIENLFGITPTLSSWIDDYKYSMYNIISYNEINYQSIIDSNYNFQPNIYKTNYSNAWAPYYNNETSYIIGDCVYYSYTNSTTKISTKFLYICILNSQGNIPPKPDDISSWWQFYTWNSILSYILNSQVTHYSRNYLSLTSSNKNNEPNISPAYWTEIWSSLVTYNIYDIVLYNTDYSLLNNLTLTYMAITSSNINQEPLYKNSLYWAPKWIYSSIYDPDDMVYYVDTVSNITSAYICLVSPPNADPPVTSTNTSGIIVNTYNTAWQPYIWVSDYTYSMDNIVYYYSILYMSIIISNLNRQPDISLNFWAKQYNNNEIYNITDLVYHDTTIYMSLINININKNLTDITSWTTEFIDNNFYSIGQFVYYTDLLIYLCKNNTSGTQNPTDINYWQPYIWNISDTNPCPYYNFINNNIIYYSSLSQDYIQTDKNCNTVYTNTVYYNYNSFLSLSDTNENQIPGSLLSSYWANKWSDRIIYSINDIVYYQDDENETENLVYKSLQNNNINNYPELESTIYWEIYNN